MQPLSTSDVFWYQYYLQLEAARWTAATKRIRTSLRHLRRSRAGRCSTTSGRPRSKLIPRFESLFILPKITYILETVGTVHCSPHTYKMLKLKSKVNIQVHFLQTDIMLEKYTPGCEPTTFQLFLLLPSALSSTILLLLAAGSKAHSRGH